MGDLHTLRGRPPILPGGVEQTVVALLEDALEQALRGEITAIAVIKVAPNDFVGSNFANPNGSRHLLVAGCVYLSADLMEK